jgi:hypothetical protein
MTTKEDDKQEGIKMVGGIQDLGHIQLQPRKRTNSNDLRILQLTDMHLFPPKDTTWILGDDKNNRVVDFIKDDYDPGNKKAVKLVKKLISSANPDLVIFTGDIIDGRPHKRRGGWRDTFGPIIEPLLKAKPPIPWTFCPGNHDDDNSPWTRKDLLQIFKLRGCATPNCVSFNHTFTVSIGTEENPHSEPSTSTRLWLFDSGGNHPKTRYDPFPKNIVKDYIEITNALKMLPPECRNKFDVLCDLAYFHIPLPEYAAVKPIVGSNHLFDAALKSGMVPSPWKYVPWLVKCLGKQYIAGSSTVNSGMFNAMKRGKMKAMFVGHDHYSDFVGSNGSGPYMGYGRVTSYAPPSNFEGDGGKLPWKPGGRIVSVEKGKHISTWIETMDGIDSSSTIILDGSHHQMVVDRKKRESLILFLIVVTSLLYVLYAYVFSNNAPIVLSNKI